MGVLNQNDIVSATPPQSSQTPAQQPAASSGDWWAQNAPQKSTKSLTGDGKPKSKTRSLSEVSPKEWDAFGREFVGGKSPFRSGAEAAINLDPSGILPGSYQATKGAAKVAHGLNPTQPALSNAPEVVGGLHDVASGAFQATQSLGAEAALAKPLETGLTIGAGALAQQGTTAGLKKLGVAPEFADLAGDFAALLAGYGTQKAFTPDQQALIKVLRGEPVEHTAVTALRRMVDNPGTPEEGRAAQAALKRKYGIDAGKPKAEQAPLPFTKPPSPGTKPPMWAKAKEAAAAKKAAPVAETPAEVTPVTPPEQPPAETPAITPEPVTTVTTQVTTPVIWKKGDAIPDYSQVVNVNPQDLEPDPATFQFKQEAIGKGGTTDEFRDVKEWEPGLGGAMGIWQDPATGKLRPVNGHHRTEIAQRTGAPFVNARFIPAQTATEARTFGAMLNIGEGKGTALDAAKLFRDSNVTPAYLAKYKISPTSKLAVQGMALSKLTPSIYRMVVDGKMTPTRGALIGDLLGDDPAAQQAAVDFFKASDKTGNRYDNAEAADIIRGIKSSPSATERIEDLFGVDEVKRNLFGERAQVSAAIGKRLGKEKELFKLVSKQANAERLGAAGNILNAEDNAKISQEAASVLAVYDKLKFSAGPVSDALNDAAKEVAAGGDVESAADRAYERIKSAVSTELGGAKPATPGEGQSAPKSGEGDSSGNGPGVEVGGRQPEPAPVEEKPPATVAEPKPPAPKPTKTPKPYTGSEQTLAKRREMMFRPGNVILSNYWKKYDKVLSYNPGTKDSGWSVTVIDSDKEGNPTPGERPRTHFTEPDRRDEVVKLGPTTKPPKPEPKKEAAPPATAGLPVEKPVEVAPRTRGARKIQGKPAEGEPAPAPVASAPEVKPRTGPKRLGKKGSEPAKPVDPLEQVPYKEPQEAKTSTGKVKMGADIKSLAEDLGSSLYKGKDVPVVTKELMQNSFDAIRGMRGGHVEVDLDTDSHTITVKDNGKGMTRKDLETVFVDLGASGKRDDESASGGFGLAKAAPLMMSKQITVESVADKGGKRYRSTMTTNKDQLLGEGVDINTVEVDKSVPTGTTVTTKMNTTDYYAWEEAEQFALNSMKSINPPGKFTYTKNGYAKDLKYYEEGLKLKERQKMKNVYSFSVPGADVSVHASFGKKGLQHKLGGVTVEVNNNGIFQFDNHIYLGDYAAVEGVPNIISMDVKATVPEGHADYPFTANREQLRSEALNSRVKKWIEEEIIKPAMKDASDFIAKKYNSLPTVGKDFDVAIFDAGAKLTDAEMSQIQKNPDFVNLSEEIAQVLDDALVHLSEDEDLKNNILFNGIGDTVERAGIVFSEGQYQLLHGVYITNPATKKATAFINPFSYSKGASPRKAASMVWHTIKHEILHDKIKGHNEQFTSGLVAVDQALGEYTEAVDRLHSAYADPKDSRKFRPGLEEAFKLYKDSRTRPEREKDPFKGESVTSNKPGSGSASADVPKDSKDEGGRSGEGNSLRGQSSGGGNPITGSGGIGSKAVSGNRESNVRGSGGTQSGGARPDIDIIQRLKQRQKALGAKAGS